MWNSCLLWVYIQGVPKKMPHSELRLLGPYRAPLKLTLGLNTPIYDTRVCVGTKETLTLPYIVPYSPYKTTVGTPVSHFNQMNLWTEIFLAMIFELVSSFKFLFEHVFMKICRNKAAICGWIFKLPDIFFFLFFYATFLRDCRDCRAL